MPSTATTNDISNGAGGAASTSTTTTTKPRRLVLCFDGTSNKFQADRSDTNIVKIYQMLERNTADQFHYYQPGIGTYSKGANENSGSIRFFPKTRAWITATIDEGFGISFVDHVTAGYKFLMRYYEPDDDIYIFGFSRGAYTARFLAEMLHDIGLLSRGNEEMVHFAWEAFSNFQRSRGNDPQSPKDLETERYMKDFKRTFCRPGVHVHFLGMFDCVNSVARFEIPLWRRNYRYMAQPAARHVRHAVSVHERRIKFRPALCLFEQDADGHDPVDLKEVWFAGNHGDVGGGWPPEDPDGTAFLLSDTPLNWMMQEMLSVPGPGGDLAIDHAEVEKHRLDAGRLMRADKRGTLSKPIRMHDMLNYSSDASWGRTFLFWIIELFPITSRLELENGVWVPRYFPMNLGGPRDIPDNAVRHPSINGMINAGILDASLRPVLGGSNFWQNLKRLLGLGSRERTDMHEERLPGDGENGTGEVNGTGHA